MSDLPKHVTLHEEGPREGFQIETAPISVADKVRFIEALAETGLRQIDCVSYVNPQRVPQMADAEEVAAAIRRKPGVRYTGLWLNMAGLERAIKGPLDVIGSVRSTVSNTFSIRNTNMSIEQAYADQRKWLKRYKEIGCPVEWGYVMTAFGCNYEGDIAPRQVVDRVKDVLDMAAEFAFPLKGVYLADTMGWATPLSIRRVVGAVRARWPDVPIALHLHDTRGTGLANAYAALQMGVAQFDTSNAGLGGCPFAAHAGAAGNICTEDFAHMCAEMGIDTGLDLEALIECALMAERLVGHPLPGKLKSGGSLGRLRQQLRSTTAQRTINPKTNRAKLADDEELPPQAPSGWVNKDYDETAARSSMPWVSRILIAAIMLYMFYSFAGAGLLKLFR